MTEKTKRLAELLAGCRKAVCIGHLNPDGDCLGSLSAMHLYLTACGIESCMITPNDVPGNLLFLVSGKDGHAEESSYLRYDRDREKCDAAISGADAVILLDLASPSRSGDMETGIRETSARKVLIDHHRNPESEFFDITISRPESSSTCELLYTVLKEMDIICGRNLIGKGCADSIFTGILTDTNVFSNSVRPLTLDVASELMKMGVDKEDLQKKVTGGYGENRLRLLGHMLQECITFNYEKGTCCMILDDRTKKMFGYSDGDSEGFVNIPLTVRGIDISAKFTQYGDSVRVSLRSKESDVNEFASRYFNGGGHRKASGGKVIMPITEVKDYFDRAVEEFYGEGCLSAIE